MFVDGKEVQAELVKHLQIVQLFVWLALCVVLYYGMDQTYIDHISYTETNPITLGFLDLGHTRFWSIRGRQAHESSPWSACTKSLILTDSCGMGGSITVQADSLIPVCAGTL